MSVTDEIKPKRKKHIKAIDRGCIDHGQPGNHLGYGTLTREGKAAGAHRVAFARHHRIPMEDIRGKVIRHTCDNPRCINPYHLLVGTHADNMRDKAVRGRAAQPYRRLLTMEDAREIRRVFAPGRRGRGNGSPTGHAALARKYGVTKGTIHNILINRSYQEPPATSPVRAPTPAS